MDKGQLEALLGITLDEKDVNKYQSAVVALEDLLCSGLLDATEERIFDIREGYSTVFTELFRSVSSVKVKGITLPSERYQARQWDKRRAEWFNSIVLKDVRGDEVAITAEWGFTELPADLKLLVDKIIKQQAKKGPGNVKSKKIEDFSVTYSDIPAYEQFVIDNQSIINKYSVCGIGEVQSGKVCHGSF